MSFSWVVGYLTTTTQHPLFGQFLEEVFSETRLLVLRDSQKLTVSGVALLPRPLLRKGCTLCMEVEPSQGPSTQLGAEDLDPVLWHSGLDLLQPLPAAIILGPPRPASVP